MPFRNPDRNVAENMKFRIPVFIPSGNRTYDKAVILLHGLNEKHWEKYLPWALTIMEETGHPVILFPIAFHMNRAPEQWASPREMMKVAMERKLIVSDSSNTSFVKRGAQSPDTVCAPPLLLIRDADLLRHNQFC